MLTHKCLLAACLLGWLLACSPSNDPPLTCPGPRPAFQLKVQTFDGRPLPPQTRLVVEYGGSGEESFQLGAPNGSPQVVFCQPSQQGAAGASGAAGAGGASPLAELRCDLWTDGAANVIVEAEGFATFRQTFPAKTSDCGILTSAIEATLRLPVVADGGA